MRYSTEPKFRKYVQGYCFLYFARKLGDRNGKKLIDTATNTEIDAAKTASKRVVQKTAEATGNLIGNKIVDKITSVGKTKEKSQKKYIFRQKKGNKLLMILDCKIMNNQENKYFLLSLLFSLSFSLSFSLHYCLLLKSNIILKHNNNNFVI